MMNVSKKQMRERQDDLLSALLGTCFFWLPLSRHHFLYFSYSFFVRLWHPIQETIWAGFQHLTDANERGHGKRRFPILKIVDRLPMHSHKLRKTFLRDTGPQTRGFHVFTEDSQDLGVCHPLFESRYVCLLTSNVLDIECRLANKKRCNLKSNLAWFGPPENSLFFSNEARTLARTPIGCGQFRPFKGLASPSVGDAAGRTFFSAVSAINIERNFHCARKCSDF